MKSKFKKILSILLTVALMLSCVVISGVSASATTKEYWVINGGTGDGRTVNTPAASVNAVIASINADNPTYATIYIKQRSDYNYQTAGDHNMTYWLEYDKAGSGAIQDITEHTASITVKPYDTSITTYLVFSDYLGKNHQLRLGGPTTFEGLTLVSPRYCETAIAARGYSLNFASDVKFGSYNAYNPPTNTTAAKFNVSNRNALQIQTDTYGGTKEVKEDSNIVFNNAFKTEINANDNIKTSFILGGYYPTYTYKKDLNVTFDNADIVAGVYVGSGHSTASTTTKVEGNINFNVKKASQIVFKAYNRNSVVANAFQMIVSNGTISGKVEDLGTATLTKGAYYLYNQTGDENVLSFTETAGVYAVKSGANISAVNKSTSETINVIDGTLTLTAGEWDIITRVADKSYYVKNGATGSGASYDDPAGSIAEVIEQMNADGLNAYNVADVYIIHNDTWNTVTDTSGTHGMAYWRKSGTTTETHKAKMVIKPYTTTETTYLAFSETIGLNNTLVATGPVSFENIVIVEPRFKENAFIANGNDVTFGEGVSFASYWAYSTPSTANSQFSLNNNAYWSILTGNTGSASYPNNINLTVASKYVSSTNSVGDTCKSNIRIGNSGNTSAIYAKDVNITINSLETNPVINFGNGGKGGTTTVTGNINLNLKASLGVTLTQSNYYWDVNSNVSGDGNQLNANAFQAIITSGSISGDITKLSKVSITNGCYYLYNKTGNADIIKFTDTAGEYVVTDNTYVLIATNKNDGSVVESSGGLLKLDKGSWDITAVKPAVTNNYYVKYGGTGNGKTVDTPAATVADVISTINTELGAGDVANIKILPSANRDKNIGSTYEKGGKLEHGYTAWSDEGTIPQHSAKIIVQAIDPSVTTYLAFSKYVGYNATLTMNGPTEFKNITLLSTRTIYRNISHNGNSVTYGAGTKYACMPHDASTGTGTWAGAISSKTAYSTYFGVSSTKTYDDDVEVVYENEFASSGSVNDSIFLSGSSWGNNTYKGDMKLVVNNEKASLNIYFNDTTKIEGDFTIDVKKAVALTFTDVSGSLTVDGSIQVLVPYGASFGGNLNTMANTTVKAGKGIYILNVVSDVENALTLTDVPGTYTVAAGYKAIARNVLTGEETAPSEGTLVVEPNAMYDVSLVDSYYNNGETITVYKTSTIDVANEKHSDKEGKVFIGWKKNGSFVAQSATYNAGDVLTAEYVNFTESDFAIEETQLRTENTAIRYIFKQNKAAVNSLPNVSEYGAIYLPTDVSKGAELRVDEPTTIVWAWNTAEGADKNDMYTGTAGETPIKVSTPNILMESTTEKRYTVCLTGDNLSSNYATFYTVRGYIKFVDGNGLPVTIYCREETSSANKVAKEDDNKTAVHNTIINKVKAEYAAFAAKFTYTEDKYYGKSNSGHESTFIDFKRNTNTSDSFGILTDGSVSYDNRIVTINTGYDDIEDIDIGWLTDMHLSYVNNTDVEKQNILALSSYRGRTFYRGAINRTIETLNNMMKRYSTTVITGDIVDYQSDGILMSVRNLVAKKSINNGINNNILMTTGNHEFADSCQPDIDGLVGNLTIDDMYKGLYSAWAHDVKYHEEILYKTNGDPNVMLISMDNGKLKMADGIAPYFEASMKKAKQLGIPMFIFCHVPLNTYNDTETKVWFNKNEFNGFGTEASNDGSANFRDNGGYCHDKWDDNTATIINLIRKNPDVVKGIFNGHEHRHIYTEITALNEDGTVKEGVYIPQFTSTTINYKNQLNQISIR